MKEKTQITVDIFILLHKLKLKQPLIVMMKNGFQGVFTDKAADYVKKVCKRN